MTDKNTLVDSPFQVDVKYLYEFENGEKASFQVNSDLKGRKDKPYTDSRPLWAELSHHQCEICPLKESETPYCPAALALVDIVEHFIENPPGFEATITVTLPEKTIIAKKNCPEGLAALIGLRLATSKCPYLSRFRLMARFHEPFSSPYYTVYRATSMYLLKQYFRYKEGNEADWELTQLSEFYDTISQINLQMSKRLSESGSGCCNLQVLSVFSLSMTLLFDEYLDVIKELEDAPL